MIDVAAGNAVYYYHFDGLGSVAALSNNNGAIVERYSYDVFGDVTIKDANDQRRRQRLHVHRPKAGQRERLALLSCTIL